MALGSGFGQGRECVYVQRNAGAAWRTRRQSRNRHGVQDGILSLAFFALPRPCPNVVCRAAYLAERDGVGERAVPVARFAPLNGQCGSTSVAVGTAPPDATPCAAASFAEGGACADAVNDANDDERVESGWWCCANARRHVQRGGGVGQPPRRERAKRRREAWMGGRGKALRWEERKRVQPAQGKAPAPQHFRGAQRGAGRA